MKEEEEERKEEEKAAEAPRAFPALYLQLLCPETTGPIPQVPGEGELAPDIPGGSPGLGFWGGCSDLAGLQSQGADGPRVDTGGPREVFLGGPGVGRAPAGGGG